MRCCPRCGYKPSAKRYRLSPAQVLAIRQDDRPCWKIGLDYGISGNMAWRVKNRISYEFVADAA